ncbi:MAG: hypothetical protein LBU32_10665 [Clostridiales bacterium]|jgi:hypothetical protein|nr:hypothetical protein [Clostridiales bacterium]
MPEDALNLGESEIIEMFLSGEGGIILSGPNATWLMESEISGLCGIIGNISGSRTVSSYITFTLNAYHGFNQTKHPEETKAFLKWLAESNYSLFEKGGINSLPLRKSYQAMLSDKNQLVL